MTSMYDQDFVGAPAEYFPPEIDGKARETLKQWVLCGCGTPTFVSYGGDLSPMCLAHAAEAESVAAGRSDLDIQPRSL